MIFIEKIAIGKEKKKKQTVRWRVRFINIVTDKINPMVKFVREYADGKILLVYTDDITEGITMEFKKKNHMVTWNFYW
jgi:hypothetical protein